MEINGNNIYKIGSILPVAIAIEGVSPDVELTIEDADLHVRFYAVDECNGIIKGAKVLELSLMNDDDKICVTEEFNTFACVVDTSQLDEGRLAGEVIFNMPDEYTGFDAKPAIPFLTDYILKKW